VLATKAEVASTKGAVALPAGMLLSSDRCSQAGTVATKHPRGHEGRAGRPASEET